MSKRRITHQQAARIKKNQNDRILSPPIDTSANTAEGLVIARLGRRLILENAEGQKLSAALRPHLHAIVAGDRVLYQQDQEKQNNTVVVSLFPRQSVLMRADSKPIAANITQIIIVVSPRPMLSWILLDSYLIMADYLNLTPLIVFNKIDLDESNLYDQLEKNYGPLGYAIVKTGLNYSAGDIALSQALNHQTSIFVGQSGVGKSSLITRILPDEKDIQTGEISSKTHLGCHTTSNTRLYHLPNGGALIDSPGIREFSLSQLKVTDIAKGYREFKPLISLCKYRNCNHHNTPGCAIINSVKLKLISALRYENYVKLSTQHPI